MLPQLYIPHEITLPDNDQWQYRFQVESENSNRIYVIAQNKKKKHWACNCPGWKRHRHCKHLKAVGVPGNEQPFEVDFQKS
jgi:hypothetical protein